MDEFVKRGSRQTAWGLSGVSFAEATRDWMVAAVVVVRW